MFLRQFEYLIALEQEGHFGRAAERCHVSQPSLSSALQQLEEELDVPIILRHQRYQGLTPEGERVVSWAKRLLADRKSMLEELAIMRRNLNGRIRVGAMPTSLPVLPRINQLFQTCILQWKLTFNSWAPTNSSTNCATSNLMLVLPISKARL